MTWRDPKGENETTEATCDNLRELAAAYSPILRYDDGERVFPVLAESWLTHTTGAAWQSAEADEDDLPVDPHRRGTAVCQAGVDLGGLQVLGGTPNPADRPLQFSSNGFDPDAIGRFADVDALTFLDFGGWLVDEHGEPDFRRGDADYLLRAFSELSAAMNPAGTWQLIERDQHLPHMWVPQPVNPTVYAEVEWAGMYPRWSAETRADDFPTPAAGGNPLDPFMCLTYYYLYSLREPPPDGESTRRLEGQWEAISLLFAGDPGRPGASGRPSSFYYHEAPQFVVISKGIERSVRPALRQHPNEVRAWADVERVHAHPVIYVTRGTHRHSFTPVTGTRWDPATNPPAGGGTVTGGMGEFPGPEMFLVWSAAAAGAAGAAAGIPIVGPLLAGLLLTLALFLFLAWLILTIWDAANDAAGDPVPPFQDIDEGNGEGTQGGSTEEPPAGGSSGPDPTATQPPGTPNAGSPTGRDIVSFDVRLVDLLNHADDRTGFPSADACEHPHWWSYSGGWGVNVRPAVDNDWESGTRRVDEHHRSWGYWNALRMLTFVNGGSAGP